MLRAPGCWMLMVVLASAGVCRAADLVAETPEAAAADPDFALQGEYEADRLGVHRHLLKSDYCDQSPPSDGFVDHPCRVRLTALRTPAPR